MSIENRVKRCIADQAECSTSGLDADTSLETNLRFDRLDLVELLMLLGEEFDSSWEEEDFNKNCRTVGDVVGWIEDSLNNSPQTITVVGVENGYVNTTLDSDEESTNLDLIQQMITLQQEYNLMMEFYNGDVIINFENNDTEYNISSQKELTTLIEASNVLKSFERK